MDLPDLLHPRAFSARGFVFRVKTYEPITDELAEQIVRLHLRSKGFPKSRRAKTITILWTGAGGF